MYNIIKKKEDRKMKKLKIGIIGTGNISRSHMDSYRKNPNVELYALCDIDEGRLKKAGEEYGITRLYTDLSEMLALPEIDAVSVCTWNSAHAPCTIAALNAGKHVLCEKPMATTVEDAVKMKEAAEKNGKLLMIGFVRRFGNDMKMIRDFQSVDYFGDIYYAKANYLRRNGNPCGWFGEKELSGGGPLIDLGVHVIDFIRYAMGNPKPVSVYGATFQKLFDRRNIKTPKAYVSASSTKDDYCNVEDMATALVRFENGAVLQVEAAFSMNIENDEGKLELYGTKAGVRVGNEIKMFTEQNDYLADVTIKADASMNFSGIFQNEIDHYVDCVLNGTECKNPAEDGVEIMKILTAVYKSAETGHEVVIE